MNPSEILILCLLVSIFTGLTFIFLGYHRNKLDTHLNFALFKIEDYVLISVKNELGVLWQLQESDK